MKLKCKLVGRKGLACEHCTGIIVIEGSNTNLKLKMYGKLPKDCPYTLADLTKSDKVEIIEK